MFFYATLLAFLSLVKATPVLYDWRAPLNFTQAELQASNGPYLSYESRHSNVSIQSTFVRDADRL